MTFHLYQSLILPHEIVLAMLYVYTPTSFLLTLYHGKFQTWIKVERIVKQTPSSHHELFSHQIPSSGRSRCVSTPSYASGWLFWSKSLDIISFHLLSLPERKKNFFLKKKDILKCRAPQSYLFIHRNLRRKSSFNGVTTDEHQFHHK